MTFPACPTFDLTRTSAYQTCSQFSSISTLGRNESKEMQGRPNKKITNQTFLDSQKGFGSNTVEM